MASFEGANTVYCLVRSRFAIKSGCSFNNWANPCVSGSFCKTVTRSDPPAETFWQRATDAAKVKKIV